MHSEIIEQLKKYISEINPEHLKIEETEFDEKAYEIVHQTNGEMIASIQFDEKGRLTEFSVFSEQESGNEIEKEKIIDITNDFNLSFFQDDLSEVTLTSVIDLDEFYIIEYNRKDPVYGMELPNSGISFHVGKGGNITNVSRVVEEFSIETPTHCISADEAKKKFLNTLQINPIIAKYMKDVYVDGDDSYHFVYEIEDYVMDIDVEGNENTIKMFGFDRQEYISIRPVATDLNIHQLAGILNHQKVIEVKYENDRIEYWCTFDRADIEIPDEDLPEYIEMEVEDFIRFRYKEDGRLIQLVGGGEFAEDTSPVISLGDAYQKALMMLTNLFPDAHKSFLLLKEEHECYSYDEEGNPCDPYAYSFTFQYFERGVKLEVATVAIQVNATSGNIQIVDCNEDIFEDFSSLELTPAISVDQAKEVFANALVMQLSWSKDVVNDVPIYKLGYLPSFPETIGHIRMINAKTGQPWVIDTTGLDEF